MADKILAFGLSEYMGVSKNRGGPPKSSILRGFSIINHPFWGTPIFGNTHIYIYILSYTFPKTNSQSFMKFYPFLFLKKKDDHLPGLNTTSRKTWKFLVIFRDIPNSLVHHAKLKTLNTISMVKGQWGVPLTVYPWYLLCSLGILGDYNP